MWHLFDAGRTLAERDAVAAALLGLSVVAVFQAGVGLGRTRQWYMLPVMVVLTALAGFLLNPWADALRPADLQLLLTSRGWLTSFCIAQFILTAASLARNWQLDAAPREHLAVRLAVLSVIPAPLLVLTMLLWEQAVLATAVLARPEVVGREMGSVMGLLLAVVAGLVMCRPSRVWSAVHTALSATLLLTCLFLPLAQEPLPQPSGPGGGESWVMLACAMPAVMVIVVFGFLWPGRGRELTQRAPCEP